MAAQTKKGVLGELKQLLAPLRLQSIDTYHSRRLAPWEHGENPRFCSNQCIDFKGAAIPQHLCAHSRQCP